MPSKIRVLTEHTINKIAAGEVIENPASVVKELVENAIDAGSSEISIEIRGGGRQLIRISDNGCGMNGDDALLCLERHATSKIREVEDIHDVTTLGFRGEAIPSIASISKFMLLTCPHQEDRINAAEPCGTMIMVDGGKVVACSAAVRSPGTTIEVKSLFFNVPVRKKFLKSPTVDTNEILKMTSLLALGHPKIKFHLMCDGKNTLITPFVKESSFADSLNERVESVLGSDFLQNCLPFKFENEHISLCGIIGSPSYTRHNRTGQFLFINHRAIFSPLVAYAIKEGYGTALPTGRHPVFVLHFAIPGSLIDVNVHPQKREVRLRQEHILKDLIIKGVEQALQAHYFHASKAPLSPLSPIFTSTNAYTPTPSLVVNEDWLFRSKTAFPWNKPEAPQLPQEITQPFEIAETSDDVPIYRPISDLPPPANEQKFHSQSSFALNIPKQLTTPKVIATIPGYIVLEGGGDSKLSSPSYSLGNSKPSGLLLVDQKAAHARVIYEKLCEGEKGQVIPLQSLLIPYSFEMPAFEAALMRASMEMFNKMGIHIQEFGTNTFLIETVPQIFGDSNLELLVADLLRALQDTQSDQLLNEEKHKRISLAASRAAISCQRKLSLDEAQSLINQLAACECPYRCPQGKSTVMQLTPEELSKQFLKC